MKNRTALAPRKTPKQARSVQMRKDIVEACIRVLKRDGIHKLTTPRIAETAGVSVGSVYQYFPNKEAILLAVHSQRIETAWAEVQPILDDQSAPARDRIRRIAEYFFRAETEDVATLGHSTQEIDQYLGEDAQHYELTKQITRRFRGFVRQSLPAGATRADIDFSAQLIMVSIDGVGRSLASRQLPGAALDRWAATIANMLADQLELP